MMVLGLDVSLSTGVALPDGSLCRITLRAKPQEPGRRLSELSHRFETLLRTHPPRPELAVIEGPALGGPGVRGKLTLAALRAVLLLRLFELEIPVLEIEPSKLKRYATGNGAARKEQMIAAAEDLGGTPRNDDEADAYLLRHLGRAFLGLEDVTTDHGREILALLEDPR